MVRWVASRLFWGIALIVIGAIILLDNLGVITFGELVWSALFLMGGLVFLSVFVSDREKWWALIPGFVLLGIGGLIALEQIAPQAAEDWGGALVLGGIALAFIAVYFVNPQNWWAIIPAGVLATLVVITIIDDVLGSGMAVGGVLFIGIALTFVLVAVLPNPSGRMSWAWIPALVMGVFGILLFASAEELLNYVWPTALILIGAFLILRGFLPKRA